MRPTIPADWEQRGQTLVREFQVRDFDDGMRLMDRIATGAVDYGRRPDMRTSAPGSVRETTGTCAVCSPHDRGG